MPVFAHVDCAGLAGVMYVLDEPSIACTMPQRSAGTSIRAISHNAIVVSTTKTRFAPLTAIDIVRKVSRRSYRSPPAIMA